MRISDWSSDVCSSDLLGLGAAPVTPADCGATPTRFRTGGEGSEWIRTIGVSLPLLRSAIAWAPGEGLTHAAPTYRTSSSAVLIGRSEEHTSELQSLMRISYAVFCLKKKKTTYTPVQHQQS